jgi:transposase-like protein
VDETYLKVRGRWCYLYRAIDRNGDLVDTMLSEHRDMAAAQAFFRSAQAATGMTPDRVTTDGHGSYPRAIRTTLGRRVAHRTSRYKNNRPGTGPPRRQRPHPMYAGLQELRLGRALLSGLRRAPRLPRPRTRHNQHVPADRRRLLHLRHATAALAILEAA